MSTSMSTFGRVPIGRGATACPATVEATHRPHRVHAPRHPFSTSRAAVAWSQRAPRPSRRAVRPASRIGVRARERSATGPRRRKPSGSMGARNGVGRGAAEPRSRRPAGPTVRRFAADRGRSSSRLGRAGDHPRCTGPSRCRPALHRSTPLRDAVAPLRIETACCNAGSKLALVRASIRTDAASVEASTPTASRQPGACE